MSSRLTREGDGGCRGDQLSAASKGKRQGGYLARRIMDVTRSSRSFIIWALEAFEIPGQRRSDSIPGQGWQRPFGHSDMKDALHDGGVTMTNSADTTIRALDKL